MTSNDDIMRALGRLEEAVEHLREDFQQEKDVAHESRAIIHRRLDDQVAQVAVLDKTVAIAGAVDAQLRDKIDRLAAAVEPALSEWGRLKTLGYTISGLIALAGMTVGGLLYWASEAAITTVRHWLRIQ